MAKRLNDQAGFWYEDYDRGQLLCIRWGTDPPTAKETSLLVKANAHRIGKKPKSSNQQLKAYELCL